MKRLTSLILLAATTTLAASACGKSPTSPTSPTGPSESGSISERDQHGVLRTADVTCPEFGESSRCYAIDNWSQDVSALALWSTSNPAIATVDSTGLVTAHQTGEVEIQASYKDGLAVLSVWAIPGRGLHGLYRTLQGSVISPNGNLEGVVLTILNGPNAGRTATTFASGGFVMGSLQDGQFTIRLTKSGYVTREYVWSIPGGRDRTATLTPVP